MSAQLRVQEVLGTSLKYFVCFQRLCLHAHAHTHIWMCCSDHYMFKLATDAQAACQEHTTSPSQSLVRLRGSVILIVRSLESTPHIYPHPPNLFFSSLGGVWGEMGVAGVGLVSCMFDLGDLTVHSAHIPHAIGGKALLMWKERRKEERGENPERKLAK